MHSLDTTAAVGDADAVRTFLASNKSLATHTIPPDDTELQLMVSLGWPLTQEGE